MLDEGIVLLGSTFCQWLEPVGVVGNAILVSPLLDAFGYGVWRCYGRDVLRCQ